MYLAHCSKFSVCSAGVLDDTYALCIARKQPLSVLLSLMEVYRSETDYTVLMCMTNVSGVAPLC